MRQPLVAPLVSVVAGIVLARYVPFTLGEAAGPALWLLYLALLARWHGTRLLASACLHAAIVLAGAGLCAFHAPPPPPEIDAGPRETLTLSGCVVEPSVFQADREQFTLDLDHDARARVTLPLRANETGPALLYGQKVELDARLRTPRNFRNPGSFDYSNYLARTHIYWTATASAGATVTVLPGSCGSRFERFIFTLRTAALERIQRLYPGDTYSDAMMEAILIGETSKLQRVWTEHFRRTGTFHALVISGMHIAVLAATLLFLLRLLFIPELWRLLLAAAAAWIYALVSGWQPPVVRSAGGFTLFLVARYFYRRGRVLNLVAAVAIAILACDPEQLFDPSFQLSFLSVAMIGALAGPAIDGGVKPWATGLRALADPERDLRLAPRVCEFRIELRLLAETIELWLRLPARRLLAAWSFTGRALLWGIEMMLLSAVIQIGLALPMIFYFHRVSLTGLTANLAIVPMMNALVPVGFLAIFTGWSAPATLARWLLGWSETVAAWHTRFEPGFRTPDPPLWLAVGFAAALALLALTIHFGSAWRRPAAALVLASFGALVWNPFLPERGGRGELELTMIDVGQGDSLLAVLPDGRVLLVDGGGIPAFGRRAKSRMEIGEDVVSPYLWKRGIRRVDIIAVTHGHEDHCGGVPSLIENFHPSEIWTGNTVDDDPGWTAIRERARQAGVPIRALHAGESRAFGGARVDALAPLEGFEARSKPGNNDSLVLRLRYGRHSFLLAGDIEKQVEWGLLDRGAVEHADVLKVAHHGSRTSTTPEFLERVRPEVALISAGYENSYRLPNKDVVTRLEDSHSAVFRTDLWGLVTVRSDGRRLRVETARWGY